MEQMLYPSGRSKTDEDGNVTYFDPTNPSASDQRGASMAASLENDEQLRYQMGSSRKKGKNENIPEGSYALAEYPGLRYDIENAARGMNPRGGLYAAIPPGSEEWKRLQELRKQWAANQGAMMPQGNFVSRMGGR